MLIWLQPLIMENVHVQMVKCKIKSAHARTQPLNSHIQSNKLTHWVWPNENEERGKKINDKRIRPTTNCKQNQKQSYQFVFPFDCALFLPCIRTALSVLIISPDNLTPVRINYRSGLAWTKKKTLIRRALSRPFLALYAICVLSLVVATIYENWWKLAWSVPSFTHLCKN